MYQMACDVTNGSFGVSIYMFLHISKNYRKIKTIVVSE